MNNKGADHITLDKLELDNVPDLCEEVCSNSGNDSSSCDIASWNTQSREDTEKKNSV